LVTTTGVSNGQKESRRNQRQLFPKIREICKRLVTGINKHSGSDKYSVDTSGS
jgi:hypothetical protein